MTSASEALSLASIWRNSVRDEPNEGGAEGMLRGGQSAKDGVGRSKKGKRGSRKKGRKGRKHGRY